MPHWSERWGICQELLHLGYLPTRRQVHVLGMPEPEFPGGFQASSSSQTHTRNAIKNLCGMFKPSRTLSTLKIAYPIGIATLHLKDVWVRENG